MPKAFEAISPGSRSAPGERVVNVAFGCHSGIMTSYDMKEMKNPAGHFRTVALGMLLLAGLLVGLAFIKQDALLEAHHRSKFEAKWAERLAAKVSAFNSRAEFDAYIFAVDHELYYHQSRLVELGAVRSLDLELTNINWNDAARNALIAKIDAGDCPPYLTWHSIAGSSPMSLTVWCDPEHVDAWKSFLSAENERGR